MAETRTWVFAPEVAETRLETEPQAVGAHQENGLWNYEHAPGCTQAAENVLPSGVGGTGSAYNKLPGQGLYVLREEAGAVRYIGRGDAPQRLLTHANTPGKDTLVSEILWNNNLTKSQAKGLEQRLINQFGGAVSQNANTPLLNQIRSFSPANPNAAAYRAAVTDDIWQATMQRLGL